ncbi:hypothetical protein B7494_g3702 [Chlorociboria aeruginascens]|nr:hypothetical protein B7494_g3702 [Chlorociboria aeruginascens]
MASIFNAETTPLIPPSSFPATTTKPLSDFTRLNHCVSTNTPTPSSTPPDPLHPTIILLCTWMNATPRPTAYYTRQYQTLYPSARIILSTMTTAEFIFQSEPKRRKDIQPILSSLLSTGDISNERILIHALSNGGAKRAYAFIGAYQTATGRVFPAKSLIYDSAPGIPQFKRDIYSLLMPGKKFNWFVWVPFAVAIVLITAVVNVIVHGFPRSVWRELVWGPTEGMNDERLLGRETLRAYVYSEVDKAIDYRDVETHARVGRERGYRVEMLKVQGKEAEHVRMWKGEQGEDAYWEWVQRMWGLGLEGKF